MNREKFARFVARRIVPVMALTAASCGIDTDKVPRVAPYKSFFPTQLGETFPATPSVSIPEQRQPKEVPGVVDVDCRTTDDQPIPFSPGSIMSVFGNKEKGAIITVRPSGKTRNFLQYSNDAGYSGRTNPDEDPTQGSAVVAYGSTADGGQMLRITSLGDVDASPEVRCVEVMHLQEAEDHFIDDLIASENPVNVIHVTVEGLHGSRIVYEPAREVVLASFS